MSEPQHDPPFELRPFQKEALTLLRRPQGNCHLVCIAATGSGKSLIYEQMALDPSQRILLVSPLIALARQQARKLQDLGLEVELTAGSRSGSTSLSPKTRVWIVSPESLLNPKRAQLLEQWKPTLLVVDECHCLWEWGEDFRPAFDALPSLLSRAQVPKSVWLTATLPQKARQSLLARIRREGLNDSDQKIFEIGRFGLPEKLKLEVRHAPWPSRAEILLDWVTRQEGAGIVFVSTRESTLRVQRVLSLICRRTAFYHAGMSSEERRAIEKQVENREVDVIISTSAFGMGMNYSHLNWVVLWQAPASLLSFAQAVGRVSRGGLQGKALALWDREDFKLHEWSLRGSERRRQDLLDTFQFYQTEQCRKRALISYFEDSKFRTPDCCAGLCDYCVL